MVLELQKRLAARIRSILQSNYQLDFENIPIETPPDLKLGELATPIALQLARTLRKAPKIIAQEIAAALLTGLEGFFQDSRSCRRGIHQCANRPRRSRAACGNFAGTFAVREGPLAR